MRQISRILKINAHNETSVLNGQKSLNEPKSWNLPKSLKKSRKLRKNSPDLKSKRNHENTNLIDVIYEPPILFSSHFMPMRKAMTLRHFWSLFTFFSTIPRKTFEVSESHDSDLSATSLLFLSCTDC